MQARFSNAALFCHHVLSLCSEATSGDGEGRDYREDPHNYYEAQEGRWISGGDPAYLYGAAGGLPEPPGELMEALSIAPRGGMHLDRLHNNQLADGGRDSDGEEQPPSRPPGSAQPPGSSWQPQSSSQPSSSGPSASGGFPVGFSGRFQGGFMGEVPGGVSGAGEGFSGSNEFEDTAGGFRSPSGRVYPLGLERPPPSPGSTRRYLGRVGGWDGSEGSLGVVDEPSLSTNPLWDQRGQN